MTGRAKRLAEEATEHGNEAIRLLKMSNQIHQAEKRGLLDDGSARDAAIELNNEAIAELEKAIELQKEFIAEQDRKRADK
jgi:hypothetical protein